LYTPPASSDLPPAHALDQHNPKALKQVRRVPHGRAVAVGLPALASAVASYGLATYAALSLSRSGYAQYALFLATTSLVASVADLGVSVHLVTLFSRATGWPKGALQSHWEAQLLSYGGGVCAGLLVGGGLLALGSAKGIPIIVSGPAAASTGLFTFITAGLQATGAWEARAKAILAFSAVRVSSVAICLAVTRNAADAMVVYGLAGFAAILGPCRVVARKAHLLVEFGRPLLQRGLLVWRTAQPFAAAAIIGSVYSYVPMAVAATIGTSGQTATIGVALTWSAGASAILSIVMAILLPAGSDRSVPLREYLRSYAANAIPAVAVLSVGALLAPRALRIVFGSRYLASATPLQLLIVANIILLMGNPLLFLHYRTGRAGLLAMLDALQLAVTIGISLWLARGTFLPTGAALAVLVGVICSTIVGLFELRGPGAYSP
jgi:O-antigen/teichoic acid export membrane protein